MPSSAPLVVLAALALGTVAASTLLVEGTAEARADDCPPGSVFHSQDGYSWCEPTICQTDAQCNPEEVCRPVPLCLQVGTLKPDAATLADAGQRLVATQQCGPDQSCPQTTVCSALSRCLAKPLADRMGLLSATPSSSSTPATPSPKKSSCGCHTVGDSTGGTTALAGALAFAALLLARRRRLHGPTK